MNIETKKWEVLCSEEQIASRLKELGAQISKDYEGKKLLVVSLLKGSFKLRTWRSKYRKCKSSIGC